MHKWLRNLALWIVSSVLLAPGLAGQTVVQTTIAPVNVFRNLDATKISAPVTISSPGGDSFGYYTFTGSNISGAPSGCQLQIQASPTTGPSNVSVSTNLSYAPANTVTQVQQAAAVAVGFAAPFLTITWNCTTTFPTTGTLTVDFQSIPMTEVIGSLNTITVVQRNTAGTDDPCQTPAVIKNSVVVNISTAVTTQLVAISGTTRIYVCHFDASVAGTAPTAQFEYGTGALCATGTTVLTGTYLITVGQELSFGYGGTVFSTVASQALCLVSGGTTPSFQGVLTFVQQ